MTEPPLGIHPSIASKPPQDREAHPGTGPSVLACTNCGSRMPRERTFVQIHGRVAAFVGTLALGAGLGGLLYALWSGPALSTAFSPACLLVLGAIAVARAPYLRCLQCGSLSRVD